MTNSTLNAPNRSINQLLNSEDAVGGLIQKNKRLLILLFVLVVLAVIGYGFYSQFADESRAAYNSQVYQFEQGPLKKYTDSGADPKALVTEFKALYGKIKNYPGIFPVVITMSDALVQHKNLDEALEVLNIGATISSNEYNNYFILARLAAVYEDLNQTPQAIATLEKMNGAKLKIFEGKNYVDLGRLYLKMGNKDKAKSSFQYVIDKAHDESEFVRIAKLYLGQL